MRIWPISDMFLCQPRITPSPKAGVSSPAFVYQDIRTAPEDQPNHPASILLPAVIGQIPIASYIHSSNKSCSFHKLEWPKVHTLKEAWSITQFQNLCQLQAASFLYLLTSSRASSIKQISWLLPSLHMCGCDLTHLKARNRCYRQPIIREKSTLMSETRN